MGQGVWVDRGYRAILIMDVGGKLSILGTLTVSMCLLAATAVVASLSLGRSISAATAIGPALLLLLLGKLWVCLLVLYSAKLVGLWGLTTGTARGAFCSKERVAALTIPSGLRDLISLGEVWLRI